MYKLSYSTCLLICVFCAYNTNAQTTIQACTCVPYNTCYQALTNSTTPTNSTDGSGVIDIRIVSGGSVTSAPGTTAPPPTGTISCTAGTEVCCTPNSGCGVRYNIPPTATTTPAAGQGRYGSQPWQAVILGLDNSYVGGGVLLDNLHVLTAAHKLINRTEANIKVRLGEWNANQEVEPYRVVDVTVTRITRHPSFTPNNLFNDVAIVRLSTAVALGSSPAINTACQPGATQVYDNMRCLVSGWGRDAFSGSVQSIVKEVDVPVLNNDNCQNLLRTNTKLGASFVLNTASFICAGGEAGRDACVGDGGSPLMCNVGGKYQVVGLVAWGIGCGTASVPGVYVRVQSFLSWIQQNLN